jgi:glycosyltransferase involved in cell wall biosynthesis
MVLIHAFEQVVKRVSTASLVLCGDGPLRKSLEHEIVTKNLKQRVTLLGIVSPDHLNKIRSASVIFVLPSASEGLSLALLEAMAAGQAIIASRNESNAAALEDGKDGLLFELDNWEDLATKILSVIEHKSLRLRLGQNARRHCQEKFSNSIAASQLERLYREAIGADRLQLGTCA